MGKSALYDHKRAGSLFLFSSSFLFSYFPSFVRSWWQFVGPRSFLRISKKKPDALLFFFSSSFAEQVLDRSTDQSIDMSRAWSQRDTFPGEVLCNGAYKVGESIGRGGFGNVHVGLRLAPCSSGAVEASARVEVEEEKEETITRATTSLTPKSEAVEDTGESGGAGNSSSSGGGSGTAPTAQHEPAGARSKLNRPLVVLGTGPRVKLPVAPQRTVAVKQIKGPASTSYRGGDVQPSGAPEREARFLAMLNDADRRRHQNIIELYDVFVDSGRLFLILELCVVDLYAIIRGGRDMPVETSASSSSKDLPPLPPSDIKTYASAILKAVAHCHEHGIVHQDLKPDNFFLSRSGDLKLGDFGLARQANTTPTTPVLAKACVWCVRWVGSVCFNDVC